MIDKLKSINSQNKILFENTHRIFEVFKPLYAALSPLVKIHESFEHINKMYDSIPKISNPLQDYAESIRKFEESVKDYIEKTPEYILLIAKHGWFLELDCELSLPEELSLAINEERNEEVDIFLIEYYSREKERIFSELSNRYGNRRLVLNEILEAHNNKCYFTSIPCILAQVDGICYDITKKKFFIKNKWNQHLPQVTSEVEKITNDFNRIFLSPFQNQTPIMVQESDIRNFPCNLNRHEVLHGINTDYGTEVNSLKCISLLKYVSDVLTLLVSDKSL